MTDLLGSPTSAGSLEILLFTLGTGETFGINVFKVREVAHTPSVTKMPNVPMGVEGVISLRGTIIPIISLSRFVSPGDLKSSEQTMIVTEFSRHKQAFLVHEVDRIIRVDWDRVRAPEGMLAGQQELITAVTELPDGRLVSILDVEKVLASVTGETPVPELAPVEGAADLFVFFCDDSVVARKEITGVLDRLGIRYQQANNGKDAWGKLQQIAQRFQADNESLRAHLRLILVDAEMPEMDGYTLTQRIKGDSRFAGIPVVMHSSLSSAANRVMGDRAGVDAYVTKFEPTVLAETIRPLLLR